MPIVESESSELTKAFNGNGAFAARERSWHAQWSVTVIKDLPQTQLAVNSRDSPP
jgi:hypothetical protein